MIGESVGNFQITALLGSGGMGDVYLAEQKQIHTKVAVKLLHANISTDRAQVQRFFNEAVAVSTIKHAGTVRISDVGFTDTGRAYLIMEFLEGETLSSRIERLGQLPLADVADIGRQIAGVLAATHAEGIVHRDLKPDNIYLVRDAEMARGERVKILDFGIAKLANTNLTGSANSMGTPTYMAPEQWNHSGKVDWRADAYSLGCVVFEMCCGRPPFVAQSIGEACAMHLNDVPPAASSFAPDLPPALDALLARMLAKNPDARPGSMAEIAAGLSAFADSPTGSLYAVPVARPTTARTGPALAETQPTGPGAHASLPSATRPAGLDDEPAPRRRSRVPLVIAGVAVVGGAAAAAFVLTRKGEAPAHHEAPRGSAHEARVDAGSAPVDAPVAVPPPAGDAGPAAPALANPWIEIRPAAHPVTLGVASASAPDTERGFRPDRKIVAPATAYRMQAHEVTWSEVEPFLAARGEAVEFPPWAQDAAKRAHLPATNLTWRQAHDYCVSLQGELPSDEEWEFAARGAELRPNSWGAAKLDRGLTHTLAGEHGVPAEVMTNEQDRTPEGADGKRFYDLVGNVQEWTEGLWRADKAGEDDAWAEDGETTYRAIRGLPLTAPPKTAVQADAAAYREPACATGPCNGKFEVPLAVIGFRCAQSEHSVAHATQAVTRPRVDAGVPDAAVTIAIDAAAPPPDAREPKPDAREPTPEPGLPESLSKADMGALLSRVHPLVSECGTSSNARGHHTLTVRVAPDGVVTVQVTPANLAFHACVANATRGLTSTASRLGGHVSQGIDFGGILPPLKR